MNDDLIQSDQDLEPLMTLNDIDLPVFQMQGDEKPLTYRYITLDLHTEFYFESCIGSIFKMKRGDKCDFKFKLINYNPKKVSQLCTNDALYFGVEGPGPLAKFKSLLANRFEKYIEWWGDNVEIVILEFKIVS